MSQTQKNKYFAKQLLKWFDQYGRKDLPWQQNLSPYRVWVSEVMLQQTQVNTAIPYFERFVQRFPKVQHLADASDDDVLHHWSGLGYYSRARNLHKAAKLIVNDFDGELPKELDQLQSLPGIGRSTAGAIRATAFEKHASILDGNVKRVLARQYAVDGWPGTTAVSKQLWQIAEQLTPKTHVRAYTQAIMDLGATLCTRSKPQCTICPVAKNCVALANNAISQYPGKKPKKLLPIKTADMFIIENAQGHVLLEKRPPVGIWGGLWSLPESNPMPKQLKRKQAKHWPVLRHTFSHFHLDITPVYYKLQPSDTTQQNTVMEANKHLWYNLDQPEMVGLATAVSKLLDQLKTAQQA